MSTTSPYASDTWREYLNEVKQKSYGNWDTILMAAAPVLQPALEKFGKHVACPRHGGRDGFRFFNDARLKGSAVCNTCGNFDDGFSLLQWLYGWTFAQALRQVGDIIGVRHPGDRSAKGPVPVAKVHPVAPPPRRSPEEVAAQDARTAARLSEAWEGSFGLMEPQSAPVRAYLKGRGIIEAAGPLEDLRGHPGMPYFENNVELGSFPVMLALLRQPDGNPCTLQRIYLTQDGKKAPVESPKKVMPRRSTAVFMGSAVRLDHDVGSVLLATEGVENGLAVRAMAGLPTWASTVSGLLEGMAIPESVRVVVIFGDKDRPRPDHPNGVGYSAAQVLAERLRGEGRKVSIYLPPFALPEGAKSLDWLDVLETYGLEQARRMPIITNVRDAVAEQLKKLGLTWESARVHH